MARETWPAMLMITSSPARPTHRKWYHHARLDSHRDRSSFDASPAICAPVAGRLLRCLGPPGTDRATTPAVRSGIPGHPGIPSVLKSQPLRLNWTELNRRSAGSTLVSDYRVFIDLQPLLCGRASSIRTPKKHQAVLFRGVQIPTPTQSPISINSFWYTLQSR